MKQKVICLDWGILSHRGIFAYNAGLKRKEDNPNEVVMPSTYNTLAMMFSALRRIGVDADVDDQVLICVDSYTGNWRKKVDPSYKGGRKEAREKALVNWKEEFAKMNDLLEKLDVGTPFHIIKIQDLECDDIIAETCRYFKDKEVVIVSYDKDFEQLLSLDNVKIFSTHPSAKKKPYKILNLDREKEIALAFKSLATKIEKEASDNLVTENITERDFDIREMIVSLLSLPEFVKSPIIEELKKIENTEKEFDASVLPYNKIMKDRFYSIFKEDKIITYEKCRKILEKKEKLKKEKSKKKLLN